MKTLYYSFAVVLFLFISPIAYAEMKSLLTNSIYFVELLIISVLLLALLFISVLLFNEKNSRAKKIAMFNEELDQKMGVMQMMMNSVREKEKNIIKITQEQRNNIVTLTHADGDSSANNTAADGRNSQNDNNIDMKNNESALDPRKLDVNGKLKQPHLGRSNYLLAMREAHSKSLDRIASIDDFLQTAITDAVDMSNSNLQEIDAFYQRLSELIKTLESDHEIEKEKESGANKVSNQKMLDTLSTIQDDFEVLMKHQQYKQSSYEKVSMRLIDNSYHAPKEVVTAVLEK